MNKPALMCVLLLLSALSVDLVAAQPVTTTKRALLIGIDEYQNVNGLRGAVNDAELMRLVLVGKFDFRPADITLLADEQATRSSILEALDDLVQATRPQDIVVIHFSGHGSQVIDVSGDELDGLDESLVSFDGRGPGVPDIVDDELKDRLEALTSITPKVTFILDSCSVFSMTRGADAGRCIPMDSSQEIVEGSYQSKSLTELDFGDRKRRFVFIRAAGTGTVANEAVFDDGVNGALTFELARGLMAAHPENTFDDVLVRVMTQVSARFPTQQPDFVLPDPGTPVFFDQSFRPEWAGFVMSTNAEMTRLTGGRFDGYQAGQILDVYPPGTRNFESASPVAEIRLASVGAFGSEGVVSAGSDIPVGSSIRPSDFSYRPHISVWLDPESLSRDFRNLLVNQLAKLSYIEVVNNESEAQLLVLSDQDTYAVASGDLTILAEGLNTPGAVLRALRRSSAWLALLEFHNPRSGATVKVSVTEGDSDQRIAKPLRPGGQVDVKISNTSDVRLFVQGFVMSSDGAVELFDSLNLELRPGEDAVQPFNTYLLPDARKITDHYKVIASTRKVNLSKFIVDEQFWEKSHSFQRGDWTTAQTSIVLSEQTTRVTSFAVHVEDLSRSAPIAFQKSGREICAANSQIDCVVGDNLTEDGSLIIVDRPLSGIEVEDLSPGEAFQEAYVMQKRLGVFRVEPLFEVEFGDDYTNAQSFRRRAAKHDPAASDDKNWSVSYIRAGDAWRTLREFRGKPPGAEAEGVRIAQLDTGYTMHPELFAEGPSTVLPDSGFDYVVGGRPLDRLATSGLAPTPGHGTAIGSVIVSHRGCQLENANQWEPCVTGVGLGSQLIPIRLHTSVVVLNQQRLTEALLAIAEHRIDGQPRVIVIPMGGPPSWSLWKAVQAAEQSGVLMISAAGDTSAAVVWPARFQSTIAAGAVNIRCNPWSGSSRGQRVDISAPGESVWHGYVDLNDNATNKIGMGSGTSYAAAVTAGAAALWVARHMDQLEFQNLIDTGGVTKAFRRAIQASAWRPVAGDTNKPETHCNDDEGWNDEAFGAGILNAAGLLEQPLEVAHLPSPDSDPAYNLPLFSSLYSEETPIGRIADDYAALFSPQDGVDIGVFEAEVLFNYSTNHVVMKSIDAMVDDGPRDQAYARVRDALLTSNLSNDLSIALSAQQ